MSSEAKYFRLGLFLLVGAILLVAAVVLVGGGRLFRPYSIVETYFNQSVQGLDVGSPVKYRGVAVGQVTDIGFTSLLYERSVPPTDRRSYVYIRMKIFSDVFAGGEVPDEETLQTMIERGLRFRLSMVGVTGIAFLELDFIDPEENPPLPLGWTPNHFYIPSAPSDLTRIVESVQGFLAKLDEVNFERLVDGFAILVEDLDTLVRDVPMKQLGEDLTSTLRELRGVVARVDRLLASPEITETLANLSRASGEIRSLVGDPALKSVPRDLSEGVAALREVLAGGEIQKTLGDLQELVDKLDGTVSRSQPEISASLENLRALTGDLRELTDWMKQYPSGALLGEPPKSILPTR